MFDIDINCDRHDGNCYYIANGGDIESNAMRRWLLGTFSVESLTREAKHLKGRILFEDIPSGQHFLTQIIEAMRDSVTLIITYHTFSDVQSTFELEPYCVKVYARRWYLLARSVTDFRLRIYALDRMEELQTTEHKFTISPEFEAREFFWNSYGVIADGDIDAQRVRIRVDSFQSNYLRTLPLHRSQQETERTEEYSIFEYYLRPTFDFRQTLLGYGAKLEVLAPQSLREQMRDIAHSMSELYEDK